MLLEQINLQFEILTADTDEDENPDQTPENLVLRNAEKKAEDVSKLLDEPAIIIAADTTVELDGVILGKPADKNDAFAMLSRMSGKRHKVHTGVCLYKYSDAPKKVTFVEQTDVFMREMSPGEIWAYIETGEPLDKAGSYGLQGFGAVFVKRVEGDYSTVIGLPLCALWRELEVLRCE